MEDIEYSEAWISNNRISHNDGYGIYFEGQGWHTVWSPTQRLKIEHNIVSHHGRDGIYLISPESTLENVTIAFNTISYNGGNGTTAINFEELDVYWNLFLNNTGYGLALKGDSSPSHLKIYENSLYYNHGSNETYNSSHAGL